MRTIVAIIGLTLCFLVSSTSRAADADTKEECEKTLGQVRRELLHFWTENDRLPEDINELLGDQKATFCYFPARKYFGDKAPQNEIRLLVSMRIRSKSEWMVLFNDGKISTLSAAEYKKDLMASLAGERISLDLSVPDAREIKVMAAKFRQLTIDQSAAERYMFVKSMYAKEALEELSHDSSPEVAKIARTILEHIPVAEAKRKIALGAAAELAAAEDLTQDRNARSEPDTTDGKSDRNK